MVVHSDRSFRRVGITTAVVLGLLLSGSGRGNRARGQESEIPTTPREGEVEKWRGNQRGVSQTFGGTASSPTVVPSVPLAPVPSYPSVPQSAIPPGPGDLQSTSSGQSPAAMPATIQPIATDTLSPAQPGRKAENEKVDLSVMSQHIIRSTRRLAAEWCSAIETCSASMNDAHDHLAGSVASSKSTGAVREEKSPAVESNAVVPAVAPPGVNTVSEAVSHEADKQSNLSSPLWLQVILVAAVVLFCPLLVAMMLAMMLRRLGMQFRVEVINSSPASPIIARIEGYAPLPAGMQQTPFGQMAQPASVAEPTLPEESRGEEQLSDTAERFELGPSYEEERLAKLESLRQQELAVLQEIFQQNVRLQEEIERLPAEEDVLPAEAARTEESFYTEESSHAEESGKQEESSPPGTV